MQPRRPRLFLIRQQPLFDLTETPAHTGVCLLVEPGGVGSDGVTGSAVPRVSTPLWQISAAQRRAARRVLLNSVCLSADVCNASTTLTIRMCSEKRNDARAAAAAHRKIHGRHAASPALGCNRRADGAHSLHLLTRAGDLSGRPVNAEVDQGGSGTVAVCLYKPQH